VARSSVGTRQQSIDQSHSEMKSGWMFGSNNIAVY